MRFFLIERVKGGGISYHSSIRIMLKQNGTPRGSRTPNLLIRSQALYPIELWVHKVLIKTLLYDSSRRSF